jgi:hypothetical protein
MRACVHAVGMNTLQTSMRTNAAIRAATTSVSRMAMPKKRRECTLGRSTAAEVIARECTVDAMRAGMCWQTALCCLVVAASASGGTVSGGTGAGLNRSSLWGGAPEDPCREHLPPGAGDAWLLPPRKCWAERGSRQRWSMTVLTRPAMQHILFRGQLLETPPYRAPIPVHRKALCDGSQSGGGHCHYGVTRSLLRGLQLVGHNFTFNPPNASLYGHVIWALRECQALAASGGGVGGSRPSDLRH